MTEQYRPGDDIQTGEQHNDEELALTFLQSLRLLAGDHYDKPAFTLEQNGVGFAPLGNIMAICAEMKNGKTWLMLSLAVALLKGEWGELKSTVEHPQVLWFDTEQDKYDSMLILRRVHQMCGWEYNVDKEAFQIYNLRNVKFDKRKEAILSAIALLKPTIVFIDGIRDLVQSVNEEQECYDLINELMTATAEHHCSIWSVLHVNPNSDKMRGHLGTELGNKVTDVFNVKKEKDKNTGSITFAVEQVAARHRDVDGWKFAIRDYPKKVDAVTGKTLPGLYSVPYMLTVAEARKVEVDKWQAMHDYFAVHMPNELKTYSKTNLKESIAKAEGIGVTKAWDRIKKAIEAQVLEECIDGKFRLKKSPPDNSILEEQQDIPF